MMILHGEKQALKTPEVAVPNTYVNLRGISTRDSPLQLGKQGRSLGRVNSLQLKAQLIEEKNLYSRCRSRLGTPLADRKALTEEDLKRFEFLNDGFPLPRTKTELQDFDAKTKRKESPLRNKRLSIRSLKAKINKIQTPAKPKFLERLITGVGSKLSKSHNKINEVVAPGNIAEDSSNEAVKDAQAEGTTSCLCPLGDSRPVSSSPEFSDYEEIHLYEVPESHFAPLYEQGSPCSTPTSPKLSGIVRQRCNEFQRLNTEKPAQATKILKEKTLMECQIPKSMPSSPQNRAKHISDTIEKLTSSLAPVEQVKKTAVIKDEYLANATMAAGYVRAFVEKINQSNRASSDGGESNGCTPGHSIPNSPCLRKSSASDEVIASKNRKNSSSRKSSIPRNGIVSLPDGKTEFLGKHSSIHREKTSSISDQGINSLSPEELFDRSWSESDTFEDDYSSNDDSCLEDAVGSLENEEAQKPKDIRYKIVEELLKTERAYVTKLHLVDQVFHFKVIVENQAYNFFSADVIQQIFSNIKSIYQFHHDFMWPQLEKRMKNWNSEPRIGDLMKKNAPFLKLYSEYVKNFDNAMNLMNECTEKCPRFAAIVKEIQQGPDCANLTLQHHMLEPIQRVPRYELLLKDYLKHLPEDSPDRKDTEEALQKVTEAASHSNEAMNKIEKFRKLLEVHQSLGQAFDLISPTRELVREGRVTKISARSGEKLERYLFLFNDLMLVCSEPLLGTYKIRASLDIDGMEVKEAEIPNAFYVKSKQKTIELLNDGPLEDSNSWYMSTSGVINEFNSRKQTMRALEQAQNLPDGEGVGKRAPTWVKDDAAIGCMVCTNQFTTFRRRHHCRGCGNVVCAKCSSKKVPLSYDDNKLNRVCDKCFELLDTTNLPKSNGDVSSDKKSVLQSKKKTSNATNTTNPQSGTTEILTHAKLEKEGQLKCKATDPSIISGYLHISSDNCKNWYRRWFAVHTSFVMYVFKGHQDGCALSTMPLPGYTVTEVDENDTFVDRTHVFKLHHGEQQVHYFKAESDEQLRRWVQVLQKMVILELPESSPDSSTPSISSKEDEDYDGPDHESRRS